MDIKERVKQVLEDLDLADLEVRILENRGFRVLAAVISPSFEAMDDADRQALVWGKLVDDLGDQDSQDVDYVFTTSPRELAEGIAESDKVAPQT